MQCSCGVVPMSFSVSENECGRECNLFSNSEDVDRPSCPFSVVGSFAGHLFTYSEYIGRYNGRRSESLTRLHRRVGWSEFSLDSCCLWITGVPVAQWVNYWPFDLTVQSSISLTAQIFFSLQRNQGFIAHSLSPSKYD